MIGIDVPRSAMTPGALPSAVHHVILDRDGVLNEESAIGEYITKPESFRWLPGSLDALATLRAIGIRVSVATNQAAVGRGLMSESALASIHDKMIAEAREAHGAIDAVFYCPHNPESNCDCRKPLPGLIEGAIRASGIAAQCTLVVGDASRDLEAAQAAGVRSVLLRTGKGRQYEDLARVRQIPVFDDLPALVAEIARLDRASHDVLSRLDAIFSEHTSVVAQSVSNVLPTLAQAIEAARTSLRNDGKILACGNGGSAADVQHFVAELVGRYQATRGALPALSLIGDPPTFTAISNDFGFDLAFARQVEAFARPGDIVIAVSTSGNSLNVINAAQAAKARGCIVIALTGEGGGALAQHADITIRAPSQNVPRIQEVHGLCLHSLAEALDSVKPIGASN